MESRIIWKSCGAKRQGRELGGQKERHEKIQDHSKDVFPETLLTSEGGAICWMGRGGGPQRMLFR